MALPARALFVLAILTGSFLLFLVQPLVARQALPRLGGAPAVWNSAMLVYQALLLAGYGYAHWLGRFRPRTQAGVHLALLGLAAITLPIGLLPMTIPADAQPALWVPWLLAASIGPLFLAVSAQAPLVQRWYAAAGGGEPYALYAASNVGSFAGLIAYPLLLEPWWPLHRQSVAWSLGYGLLALLVLACATRLPRVPTDAPRGAVSPAPTRRTVAWWIALAAVPSGLMLATSTYITTDIVAMPLLWVMPLGLYLLSFTVAFSRVRAPADVLTRIAPFTLLLFGGAMMGGYNQRPFFDLVVAFMLLFMASVALHTALYRCRPRPDRLTGFYLATAAGGALGGVFAGLVAPVAFDWTYEYPLMILAAGALIPQQYLTATLRDIWTDPRRGRVALLLVAAWLVGLTLLRFVVAPDWFANHHQGIAYLALAGVGMAVVGARRPYLLVLAAALVILGGYRAIALSVEPGARTRSYFGVYTVRGTARLRELDHGTTVHGIQLIGSSERERMPTTYYAPMSGVGTAMTLAPALYGSAARIGVVGLGTGTLACYARPGQHWRFYEIDPAIVRIARTRFTYLARCLPDPLIRLGDARIRLGEEARGSLDLLALDAFSSDAVPMHLLTLEAFATYARVLSPRGLLLVHISNRFLDLEPVVAAAAGAGGWYAERFAYTPSSMDPDASPSVWIALSRNRAVFTRMYEDPKYRPLHARPGFAPWTDDYSSILPLLKGR